MQGWVKSLFDWQTLVAGLLALFGAYATVVLLWKQITQAASQEAYRLHRRRVAFRAVLPTTLVQITDYVAAVISLVLTAYPTVLHPENGRAVVDPGKLPKLDPLVFDAIRNTIEADEYKDLERSLVNISVNLQILRSRLASLTDPSPVLLILPANLDAILLDCAITEAIAASLLPYARFETDRIQSNNLEQCVRQALLFNRIEPEEHPRVFDWLAKYVANFERRRLGTERRA